MSHHPVIIQAGEEYIRASHGVADLFTLPVVTALARYGVPKTGSSSRSVHGDANGVDANGDVSMADASAPGSRSEWLVGDKLTQALAEDGAENSIEVKWPFIPSEDKDDWEGREFVLQHVYSLFNIKPSNNMHSLLFVPPPTPATLPLNDQALWCQMAFEAFNTPSFSMLPSPLATLYGLNAVTGLVVHIGRHTTEVSIVTDSVVRWECVTSVNIGEADVQEHLEQLLLEDANLDKELKKAAGVDSWAEGQKEKLVREVRDFIFAECTGDDIEFPHGRGGSQAVVVTNAPARESDGFDVAKKLTADAVAQPVVNKSHKSKKEQAAIAAAAASKAEAEAAAAIAADVIAVTIPSLLEKEIIVGKVRHRLGEPLFRGKVPGGDTVWEAMGRAVESGGLSLAERFAVWDSVAVIGSMARFSSFPPALVSYLSPFLLTSPEVPSEVQASRVRLLTIPDYIANYKGTTTDLAPFLGASMCAKLCFSDHHGRHYVNKVDYNARGPACIYGVWSDA